MLGCLLRWFGVFDSLVHRFGIAAGFLIGCLMDS